MAELSAYIPQDRRRALAAGTGLPDRADGAALLADVSGFTPLAEALAARLGRLRGAEELTTLLNQVYDVLIAAVERYGGSVVGFAGDALIGWFADAPPGPAGAAQRALAASLALQQAMRPFHAVPVPGGPSAALAIKVAVASGPARRFVVGDPAIQLLDVLAGRTIDRLGLIAAGAAPGEVLADRATIERVGDTVRLGSWRADGAAHASAVVLALAGPGLPEPPAAAAPLPDTTAEPWVLPAVRAHLRAGGDALLAELRPISALMLQFSGIDYDADPDAHPRLDAFIRQVQRTLARYEGALLDVMMADQGGYLYAICGAPQAHEDDPRRLLRAALALRDARPAGLALRMGLSQGTLRAGPYGSAGRRAYGALGDAANLAHRLMRHAPPGEVLVSAQAQAGLAGQFGWEALPPLQVKGKQRPVAAYRALAELGGRARPPTGPADALIGRAAERAALAEALGALGAGIGGTLLISGVPGIGKSRLVAELQAQAQARGVRLRIGAGDAVEQATPYAAWRPVVRELLGLVAYGLADISLRQERLDDAARVVAGLLPYLGRPLPVQYLDITAYVPIAQVALARWEAQPRDLALAHAALAACVALLRQSMVFPIGRPQAWLCLGRAAMLARLPWAARALWRCSLRAARRLGMPFDQGLAHLALGQACSSAARRAHLGHAIAIFARLGAAADLRRAVDAARRHVSG